MTTTTKPMSAKQFAFITSLIIERADHLGIEPSATSAEAWMFQKRSTYTSTDASYLIEMLKTIKVERPKPMFDTSHLEQFAPTRVMSNKFAKPCVTCGHNIVEGEGLVMLSSGKWLTVHHNGQCIEPYVGKALETARHAVDAFVKTECLSISTLSSEHDTFIALPSHTGNNDLDFYGFIRDNDGRVSSHVLRRILGGHDVKRAPLMTTVEAKRVLEIVRALTVDEMIDAQFAYASNLGRCSVCNRTLTDDESRARGMGSECWSRWGC